MSTYKNCYQMLKECRQALNEYSSDYMSGTDTSGIYQNDQILNAINSAQRYLHAILMQRIPEVFLEEKSLTASSSVITLPSDFGKLKKLKDSDEVKIFPVGIEDDGLYESNRYYYRKNNTLVINDGGNSNDTYTLIYYRKPRDLDFGVAAAGGALSITLASTAKALVDYYNGMTIENETKGWVDTIDDYTAARVATISETAAASDVYGVVSDMPEEFHNSIIAWAIIALKSHPLSLAPPAKIDIELFETGLREALAAFIINDDDSIEDVFEDFRTPVQGTIL